MKWREVFYSERPFKSAGTIKYTTYSSTVRFAPHTWTLLSHRNNDMAGPVVAHKISLPWVYLHAKWVSCPPGSSYTPYCVGLQMGLSLSPYLNGPRRLYRTPLPNTSPFRLDLCTIPANHRPPLTAQERAQFFVRSFVEPVFNGHGWDSLIQISHPTMSSQELHTTYTAEGWMRHLSGLSADEMAKLIRCQPKRLSKTRLPLRGETDVH